MGEKRARTVLSSWEPDDVSRLTIRYLNASTRATGLIVDAVLPAGGRRVGTAVFDVKTVPNGPYYLYAEVTSEDGRSCDVYWPTYLYVSNPYASDGGQATDAGLADGGPADAGKTELDAGSSGIDAGPSPKDPRVLRGCGCSGAEGGLVSGVLILIGLRRRRPVSRPGPAR